MNSFKINSPDDPEPIQESHLYNIGDQFNFITESGRLRSVRKITVLFA